MVVIDPIRTMTAESADWFVQPLPGTDIALMLAMMHVLVRDGLTDAAYVAAHTHGFDKLAPNATVSQAYFDGACARLREAMALGG